MVVEEIVLHLNDTEFYSPMRYKRILKLQLTLWRFIRMKFLLVSFKVKLITFFSCILILFQQTSISQSYEFDIIGEWNIPGGVGGNAARIRFNPAGDILVSRLEISGQGESNDFTLVGSIFNNSSRLCGDNQYISLCVDLTISSNTNGSMSVHKCDKLPTSDYGCSVSIGDVFPIERPVRLNLSGIWLIDADYYFLVTHASDGTINADPVSVSGGYIIEGASYQGNVSIATGVGLVSGTNFSDGWTEEVQILSATDSVFTFQLSKCTGNCDDQLDQIGVVKKSQRVDSRPGYSQ